MRSKILGSSNPPSQSASQYGSPMMAGGALNSSEVFYCTIPVNGTISNLRVNCTVAPGSGRSRSVTIRKNFVDVMTTTVSDTNTTDINTGLISVAAGDIISLRHDPAGTPAAATVTWCADFKGNADFQSVFLASSTTTATAIGYCPVQGATAFGTSAPANETLVSASGTISRLFITLSAVLASGTRTFTLRKNGVNTALAVTISAGGSEGSDVSNSVSVSPGDRLVIVVGGSAVAFATVAIGMLFTATTDQEATISCGCANSPSNTVANYQYLAGSAGGWVTTEAGAQHVIGACTLHRLDVRLTTAPGAGNMRQFNVKVNGGYIGMEVAITDTNTTGAVEIDVPVASGDLIVLEALPTSGPASSGRCEWALTTVQANPVTGRGFAVLMN